MNEFFGQKRQHFRITNRGIFYEAPAQHNSYKAKKIAISNVQKFFNSPKFTKVPISHINTRPKGFSPCHSLLRTFGFSAISTYNSYNHQFILIFFSALTVQPPLPLITSKTALPNILKIASKNCKFSKD